VPKFCRHGALAERCPICQPASEAGARPSSTPARPRRSATDNRPRSNLSSRSRLLVRHEARAEDDGYRSALAPGLRATEDARHLAVEIAFANGRLTALERDPPGLYAVVASEPDIEEATWLAFLIVYIGPLEGDEPFTAIEAARTPWAGGEPPALDGVALGPRGAHDPQRGGTTIDAYRRFAERFGSQEQAFTGDANWSPQQRFERIHERLALPGLHGRARYDLLVTLGRLGRYPLAGHDLLVTEDDPVTAAAKRVFGIGDRMVLERRARELAGAIAVPVEALDLGLENWARTTRITQGVPDADDPDALERALAALRIAD
jgi:hypothetical protein